MFTGIVEEIGTVEAIEHRREGRTRACGSADRSSCPTPTWATRSASPASV